jgi:hypothetical protein
LKQKAVQEKVLFNFRVERQKIEAAKKMGIKLTHVCRLAVDEVLSDKSCPTCGGKIK